MANTNPGGGQADGVLRDGACEIEHAALVDIVRVMAPPNVNYGLLRQISTHILRHTNERCAVTWPRGNQYIYIYLIHGGFNGLAHLNLRGIAGLNLAAIAQQTPPVLWRTNSAVFGQADYQAEHRSTVNITVPAAMLTAEQVFDALDSRGGVRHVRLYLNRQRFPSGTGEAQFTTRNDAHGAVITRNVLHGQVQITIDPMLNLPASCDICREQATRFCIPAYQYYCVEHYRNAHMGHHDNDIEL
ncbi:uncharacterized protein [Watersipora subatra]|uniref:uncharacterized protein n=1 Tax=Watersipora subatra TaxID=2589382 RepID=UPI00355C96DB